MSRLAQKVEQAVREMKASGEDDEMEMPISDGSDDASAEEEEMTKAKRSRAKSSSQEKPKRERKPKEPKQPKEPKVRSVTAGIKDAPKLKGLLLGAQVSRDTVEIALKAALKGEVDYTDQQRAEAERLVARLAARKG